MMEKNPFLKRLMKAKTEDVVHSSAYASAQNKQGIGVASTNGFADRMKIEKNRTTIRAYGDSEVANNSFGQVPKPKVYNAEADKNPRLQLRGRETTATNRAMMTASKPGSTTTTSQIKPPARKNPGISR